MSEKKSQIIATLLLAWGMFGAFCQNYTCPPISPPWIENFDSPPWQPGTSSTMGQIDTCWNRPNGGINTVDFRCNSGLTPTTGTGPVSGVGGSGNYLYSQSVGNAFQTGEITSPPIIIPAGYADVHLKFAFHMYGSFIDYLKVEIDSGAGFGSAVKTISGLQQTSSADPWKFDSLSLKSYEGDTLRIKFLARNLGTTGDICIDNIEIFLTPLCSKPTNLNLVNSTPTSLQIDWASSNSMANSVVGYNEVGTSNIQYISPASAPLTIQGLSPATHYLISVFDSCNSDQSMAVSDTFSTSLCDTVNAQFSCTKMYLDVNFNSNNPKADSLFWHFGDGQTDTARNPQHTYSNPGSYPVVLETYKDCGSSDSIVSNISVCDTLDASIGFNYLGSDSVMFFADSVKGAAGFLWNLDENKIDSGLAVTVKYDSLGIKHIQLQIYNACKDTLVISASVDICPSPVAKWSYNVIQTTSNGMEVQFDGTGSENVANYAWNFGDGNTGSGPTPIHTYLTPGLFYEVKLTVANKCGNIDSLKYALDEIGLKDNYVGKGFALYPNPVSRQAVLEWDPLLVEVESLRMISSNGNSVLKLEPNKNQRASIKIQLGHLHPGVYQVEIVTDQVTIIKKLVKL